MGRRQKNDVFAALDQNRHLKARWGTTEHGKHKIDEQYTLHGTKCWEWWMMIIYIWLMVMWMVNDVDDECWLYTYDWSSCGWWMMCWGWSHQSLFKMWRLGANDCESWVTESNKGGRWTVTYQLFYAFIARQTEIMAIFLPLYNGLTPQ